MRRFARAALAACLVLTVALSFAAAYADTDDPDDAGVDAVFVAGARHVPGTTSGAVTVALGERLVVDLGNQNASIGDGWFLVTAPDPAVLADAGEHHDSDCDRPGCGADTTCHFRTVADGTTQVVLRYCYRSRPPACEPMPDRGPTAPVALAVTVTTPG